MNIPPQHAVPSILDEEAIARLRALDPDGRHGVVQRVLLAFESSLARTLAQLAQAPGLSAAELAVLAHTLKSSSASVGAMRLSTACAEDERSARSDGPAAKRHDVERLNAEGQAALAAVRAILRA